MVSKCSKLLLLFSSILTSTGCATFSSDGGFKKVESTSQERLDKKVSWKRDKEAEKAAQDIINPLLQQQLDVNSAVQIALLNNPGLQAKYAELGIAEADYVQAGRLANPTLGVSGGVNQEGLHYATGIEFSLLGLLLIPSATELEGIRFEHVKLQAAQETLNLAFEARKAFYSAIASKQLSNYYEQVKLTAEAAAELSLRMAKAGNISKRDLAREQVFYSETLSKLSRTKQNEMSEKEKLIRILGLNSDQINIKLPEILPNLPADKMEYEKLIAYAIDQRLDIQIAKKEIDMFAKTLGITKATRFINVLNVVMEGEKSAADNEVLTGPVLKLEVPLFDFGGARIARYQAQYEQSVNHLKETALNAESQVRENYANYLSKYTDTKRYRDNIIPLRKKILDETVLHYNGMLVSVFELLTDAREQVNSLVEYIDTLKEFWIAESDLQLAAGGKLPIGTVVKGEEKENNLAEPDETNVKQQETEKPKINPHANHKM